MKRKRIGAWIATLVILVMIAFVALPWYAQYRIEQVLRPYLVSPESAVVSVDLFQRSISVNSADVKISPDPAKGIPTVTGRLDSLSVSGISIFQLLFGHTIKIDGVRIRATDLKVITNEHDSVPGTSDNGDRAAGDRSVMIGSWDMWCTTTSLVVPGRDSAHYMLDSLVAHGNDLSLHTAGPDRYPHFMNSSLHLIGFTREGSDGYRLNVARVAAQNNGRTLTVHDIAFGPTIDLEKFATTLSYERDAFNMTFDSISITGFDLEQWYATKAVHANMVRVVNSDIIVMRDKTLQDGPQPYRPLVGKMIRKLPPGSGVDSLVLSNLSATYHERADRNRGFAAFPFTELNAVFTGVVNSKEAKEPMLLDADCKVFGKTPVNMHMTADLQDTTDRFVVDARMGYMYFPSLNVATSPLVDVRATAGDLQSLVFHMEADDRNAHGTVAMRYEGIKLTGGRIEKDRTVSGLLSAAINALVRNDSKGAKGIDRVGTFAIERRRNRAIFNYLWTGLKEGSKGMLLPKLLTK